MNTAIPAAVAHCSRFIDTWLPGAMFPSEIAWFLANFAQSGAGVLIECGRQDGVSTEMFADWFKGTGVKVISIDLDLDAVRAQRARDRLAGYDVELVSGDIHIEVPRLVQGLAGKSCAILQDGPKGWEGLATLLAASVSDGVAMIAQHNLHKGHLSRALFQHVALYPAFVEYSKDYPAFAELVEREREVIRKKSPNRPVDHTSLGMMLTDGTQKALITESFATLARTYGPWNPARVIDALKSGDPSVVERIRARSRYTLSRFKAR